VHIGPGEKFRQVKKLWVAAIGMAGFLKNKKSSRGVLFMGVGPFGKKAAGCSCQNRWANIFCALKMWVAAIGPGGLIFALGNEFPGGSSHMLAHFPN